MIFWSRYIRESGHGYKYMYTIEKLCIVRVKVCSMSGKFRFNISRRGGTHGLVNSIIIIKKYKIINK